MPVEFICDVCGKRESGRWGGTYEFPLDRPGARKKIADHWMKPEEWWSKWEAQGDETVEVYACSRDCLEAARIEAKEK